jgi:membrane associated rhomboid family serine protease
MQIDLPDPRYTGSRRARSNFRLALKIALGFVALLWAVHLLNWALDLGLARFAVQPRQLSGLSGVLFAPLLHGGFTHLLSNSAPLVVLGTGMLYLYPHSALKVIAAVYLGSGLAVWVFGRTSLHLGASGLIYGLATYIFVAGLLRRDVRAIAASMLVYFLYGTMAWGVLPIKAGVSWETHLAGAAIGVLLAVHFRHWDIPPPKRYSWDEEAEGGEGADFTKPTESDRSHR